MGKKINSKLEKQMEIKHKIKIVIWKRKNVKSFREATSESHDGIGFYS